MITFFHDRSMPVVLLAIFGKNERVDLTQAEKNELRVMLKTIVEEYKKRKGPRP